MKVRGKWTYLYRALDELGNTIDFYLSPTRNAKTAKRFLGKALNSLKGSVAKFPCPREYGLNASGAGHVGFQVASF